MVPPGVSYTPRLFMPTKRFSTRSMRPMPLSRPRSLRAASSEAGDSFLPFSATASPLRNSISISVAASGASNGETERWCTYSGGSLHGSSSTLPSEDECRRLASTEKGASPCLSFGTGIWCFSANSMRSVRDLNDQSRHGAITLMSGLSA